MEGEEAEDAIKDVVDMVAKNINAMMHGLFKTSMVTGWKYIQRKNSTMMNGEKYHSP